MSKQHQTDIKYQLLMSLLGLLLIFLLTVFPPEVTIDVSWRKPVIGSIFSIFCLLGLLAIFVPKHYCSKLGKKSKTNSSDSAEPVSHGTTSILKGHHPTCGKFVAHIFWINDRTFCAACIGLLVGGLLALAGAVIYFFCDFQVADYSSLLIMVGIMGVFFGLFQFKFRSLIRLSLNALFVLASLLILIGVDELVHSLVFDLFVFCLIVFWLFTRISFSQWDHEIICSSCDNENCKVRHDKKGRKS